MFLIYRYLIHIYIYVSYIKIEYTHIRVLRYGVATVSRIDKITGLFCRISSLL